MDSLGYRIFLYLAFPGIHQAIEMGKALPGIREKTHIARPRLTLMLRLFTFIIVITSTHIWDTSSCGSAETTTTNSQ